MCVDDDNRVVLRPTDQYQSDYVNASYIDVSIYTHTLMYTCGYMYSVMWSLWALYMQGYNAPRKFIATQGTNAYHNTVYYDCGSLL